MVVVRRGLDDSGCHRRKVVVIAAPQATTVVGVVGRSGSLCADVRSDVYDVLQAYFGARAAGLTSECQSQLRALTRATYYFTSGNGDRMPVASTWQSDVAPFLKTTPGSKALRCPASRHQRGYAFNVNLSGVAPSKIAAPSETVLFFEGNGTSDYGGEELVASDLRHSGTLWIVTVDGSTHRYRPGGSRKLIWRLAPVKGEKGSPASPRTE